MRYTSFIVMLLGMGAVVADLYARWPYLSHNPNLILATIIDNLLLIFGIIGFMLRRKWGFWLLGFSALVGFVHFMFEANVFVSNHTLIDPQMFFAAHNGADLVFKMFCLALALDYLKNPAPAKTNRD